MQSENYIWQLFARCLNNEASPEETEHLHELLRADESLQQRYEILKQFWNSSQPDPLENTGDTQQIARILQKAHEADGLPGEMQRRRKLLSRRSARILVAGSILIIAVAAIYFMRRTEINNISADKKQPGELQQLIAQNGIRSKTTLPDGSVVWLNAGSHLSYGKFSGPSREVYLDGEAFFDVVKQPDRPFIVHANGVDIRVLGTSFDVKSYSEEGKVETTLLKGLIQITRPGKKAQKPVYLHPNEKLVINLASDQPAEKNTPENTLNVAPTFTLFRLDSTVTTENRVETAWIYDRLRFRGENFDELAKKLERWYNVKISFEDEEVKQLSFYGSFENETVKQAFAALKTAEPFEYSINEDEILIRSSKKAVP